MAVPVTPFIIISRIYGNRNDNPDGNDAAGQVPGRGQKGGQRRILTYLIAFYLPANYNNVRFR
jgi:hypothetical protein